MSDHERSSTSSHPDELLAGLVDGTLSPDERAELQSHLDGCERCRTEVSQAESARRSLRGLPELEAPWGLGRAAVEEARRDRGRHHLRKLAPVAGVAAAAILLVGLAFAVLRGPQGGGAENSAQAPLAGGGGAAGGGTTPAPTGASGTPFIVQTNANFDPKAIESLAASYSSSRELVPAPQPPAPAGAPSPGFTNQASGDNSAFRVPLSDEDAVVGCIDRAAGLGGEARPSRVIVARFDEKPALIGIYLSGPGADQPADLLVIWVASRECQLLHYASHRIEP